MCTDAYAERVRQQIVQTAEALLAGRMSFIAGSRLINGLRFDAKLENDPDVLPFVGIDSETDTLPIDENIRRLWAQSALEKLAPEIERAEAWACKFGTPHCQSLIDRFKRA